MLIVLLAWAIPTGDACAQVEGTNRQDPPQVDLVDLPIAEVRLEGLSRVSEQNVRNQIRTAAGQPYDPRTVSLDLQTLERLGDFKTIEATRTLTDEGVIVVTFIFEEQPLVVDVQAVGNDLISDQEILSVVPIVRGAPLDDFLLKRAQRAIEALYRERGHYLVEVTADEQEIEESGIVLFNIIEGPRVKVHSIEFIGNQVFTDDQLLAEIDTRTAIFLLRQGKLDEEQLAEDVAALDRFYRERGYLDVRIGREIQLSPDSREVRVVFLIEEGHLFTLRSLRVAGSTVFTTDQIAAIIDLKTGDVFSEDKLRRSVEFLREAYGVMSFGETRIFTAENRTETGEVDLLLEIEEGPEIMVGEVIIRGNFLTKDKVIRRELEVSPGRPLNTRALQRSREKLDNTRLFGRGPNAPRITIQPPDPAEPLYRDLLVEVNETNTGSVNFGAAVGSDAGVLGTIAINQRNWDLFDTPESLEELLRGRAFRGAGQHFNAVLAPGNRVSQYSLSLTEPWIFDTPNLLRAGVSFRDRVFDDYDEERASVNMRLARRLGDVWTIGAEARFERVELEDIDFDAPVDVFDSAGPDSLTGVALTLTRNTTGTITRPGRGSVLDLSVEQVGLIGGDFDFTKLAGEYSVFMTIDEDFLGRKSILRLNTRAAYVVNGDDAPVYELNYLGGRSFRGFDFRTVSPKGIRNDTGELGDDPVGGNWLLFVGAQYEFPIFDELFNGVVFVDSGTVTDDIGFDEWRVSAGVGIRLYLDALGPVPFAFDFGFPIVKEDGDETQIFSFSAEFPF